MRISLITEAIVSILNTGIRYGAFVSITYILAKELAGKYTYAEVIISISEFIKVDITKSLLLLGCMLLVGTTFFYRQLYKRTVERLAPFVKTHEEKFDSNRSSSRLTSRGDTPPADNW